MPRLQLKDVPQPAPWPRAMISGDRGAARAGALAGGQAAGRSRFQARPHL